MFAKILAVLVVLAGIFAGVAYIQPSQFDVSRSIIINAPPQAVFEQVNNLRKWEAWSPWAKLDPNQKVTFAGPEAGKDAKMSWAGNMEVGEGSMTITESQPYQRLVFNLEFVKPLKGTSLATFTFKPQANVTEVIWNIKGEKDFIQKAMGLVFNCEKMMGEYFDKGLASLKGLTEGKTPQAAAVPVPEPAPAPAPETAPASEVQPVPETAPPAMAPEAAPAPDAEPMAPEATPAPEAAPAPASPETAPQQP